MATSAEGSDLSWWLWPLEGLTGPVLSLSQRVLGAGEGKGAETGVLEWLSSPHVAHSVPDTSQNGSNLRQESFQQPQVFL